MTDEQILKKAIEKATNNGFKWINFANSIGSRGLTQNLARDLIEQQQVALLIFNHKFAEAIWGENYPVVRLTAEIESKSGGEDGFTRNLSTWQFHLLQMVLEEEPLKYIEKFL